MQGRGQGQGPEPEEGGSRWEVEEWAEWWEEKATKDRSIRRRIRIRIRHRIRIQGIRIRSHILKIEKGEWKGVRIPLFWFDPFSREDSIAENLPYPGYPP